MGLYSAIVMGSSAGGFEALREIFSSIDANFPFPIIIAQHIEKTAKFDYSMIFGGSASLQIIEAEEKARIEPGYIFFAPPAYHLYIEDDLSFGLSVDPPVNWSRPSIDLLFESAAYVYGQRLIAVLLSGANHDGAAGIAKVKERGGVTIAQAPETAAFGAMPQAAINTGKVDHVLALQDIGVFLNKLAKADGEAMVRQSSPGAQI